jgi:hypothetical protein
LWYILKGHQDGELTEGKLSHLLGDGVNKLVPVILSSAISVCKLQMRDSRLLGVLVREVVVAFQNLERAGDKRVIVGANTSVDDVENGCMKQDLRVEKLFVDLLDSAHQAIDGLHRPVLKRVFCQQQQLGNLVLQMNTMASMGTRQKHLSISQMVVRCHACLRMTQAMMNRTYEICSIERYVSVLGWIERSNCQSLGDCQPSVSRGKSMVAHPLDNDATNVVSNEHDATRRGLGTRVLGRITFMLLPYSQEIIDQPLCFPFDASTVQNIRAVVSGAPDIVMEVEKVPVA